MKITESALNKLKKVNSENSAITRLYVEGGGCAGFSYKFELDNKPAPSDYFLEGVLLVDADSYGILENSTVDWQEDLTGCYFRVDIPEASSSCGCGTSFSL